MSNYILKASIAGLLLATVSCSSDKEENTTTIVNQTPVKVQVSKVGSSTSNTLYTSSGKVQSTRSANISTRMMGYIQEINVNIGDKVKKGQLLIKLNNKDIRAKKAQVQAGIAEANAAFINAEKDYTRFKELFKSESASRKELDDITANFRMAKARLEGANQMKHEVNAQMDYTNIRSPFSGIVSSKFVNEGDLANPGMPLLSIENGKEFEIITRVSESEVSKIKAELEVEVFIKSTNKTIKGRVKEVSRSTKNSGSQYEVKIALDKCNDLFTGMYTQVHFPINKITQQQVLLPKKAIIHRGQLKGVYVVSQQNRAVLRWLRLGKTIGENVEVLSGLNPEDQYISSMDSKVENGTLLTILN